TNKPIGMAPTSIEVIKSVFSASIHVLATKSGSHVTLQSLAEAYERTMGHPVPFREHGFSSVEELIRVALPGTLTMYRVGANMCAKSTQPPNHASKRIIEKINTENKSCRGGKSRFSFQKKSANRNPSCPQQVRNRIAKLVEEFFAKNGEGCSLGHFGGLYFQRYGFVLRLDQFACNSMLSFMRFLQSCGVIDIIETPNGDHRLMPAKSGLYVTDPNSDKLVNMVANWPDGPAPLDQLSEAYCSQYGFEPCRQLGFLSFDAMVKAEKRLRLVPRLGACPLVQLADSLRPAPPASNELPANCIKQQPLQQLPEDEQLPQLPQELHQPLQNLQLYSPPLPPLSSSSSSGGGGDVSSVGLKSMTNTCISELDRSDTWSTYGDGDSGSNGIPADCVPIGCQLQPLPVAEYADPNTGTVRVSVKATCPDDLLLSVHSSRLDEQRRRLQADMKACADWQPISRRHAATGGLLCAARLGGANGRLIRVQALGFDGAPRAGRVRVRPLDEPPSGSEIVSLTDLYYLKRQFADACSQLTALAYLDCLKPTDANGQWSEAASNFFCDLMTNSSEPKAVQIVRNLLDEPPYNCSVVFVRPNVSIEMIKYGYALEPSILTYPTQRLTDF
ncbi:hypothetical protein BOX15_Mlig011907g4, partial [Macrostomum lignano]